MNTSSAVIQKLQDAHKSAVEAMAIADDLVVEHEYQDVTVLAVRAAAVLLEAATHLMQSDDRAAVGALDDADELMDAIFRIIESEIGED